MLCNIVDFEESKTTPNCTTFANKVVWDRLREIFKTTHNFFSLQKLIEIEENGKLNKFFLKNPDIAAENILNYIERVIVSKKYLRINKDQSFLTEYSINSEENIFEMNESDIDKIVRAKLGGFFRKRIRGNF